MYREFSAIYGTPGLIVGSESRQYLQAKTLEAAVQEAREKMPHHADRFRVVEDKVMEATFEDGSVAIKRVELSSTGTYYPGGQTATHEQLKEQGQHIFSDNVRLNGYAMGVTTRNGAAAFFASGDQIIP